VRRSPRLFLLVVASLAIAVMAQPFPSASASNTVSHGTQLVSQNPVNGVTPDVLDGQVRSMDTVGNTMIVGGTFTQVQLNGGPILTRNFIFAFDISTGAISTTFVPQFDRKVETVESAGDGQNVFVGGYFMNVNGAVQKRVTKLNVATGARVAAFATNITSGQRVMDMAVSGSRLYLAGQFAQINGTQRQRLAAVNVNTGALDPNVSFAIAGKQNGGNVRIQRFDVSPNGQTLVAIGNFTSVDGQSRPQIAKFNVGASPATLNSWATTAFAPQCAAKFDSYMRDVDISPDGTYFVVGTTGAFFGGPGAGVYCDSITRWEMGASGSGQAPTWREYTGGDTTWSVLSTGSVVYVGGHMRWMNNPFASDAPGDGSVVRQGIAALDPLNGLPFSWNPRRDPRREGVFKFLATPTNLYFGSDSCCVGGERHERLASFPVAGGSTIPAPSVFTLPNDLYLVPDAPGSQQLTRRSFNGTAFSGASTLSTPGTDWSNARGAFLTNGFLYTGWSDGKFYRRTFNGAAVGPQQEVSLNGLSAARFPVTNITGMFLDGGRLYYTVAGNNNLFYRYFTHQTPIVGAETFTVPGGGVSWGTATGMTLAGGRIYFSASNGNLSRVDFANGVVSGAATVVSGPGVDGINWKGRGLFMGTAA
jgi:hypothetical protein